MITSTTINKKLFKELPHPLAISWNFVLRSQSAADQIRQCWALLDVYLRYVSGILLAAYLREPPIESVEEQFSNFSKPSLGHYCALIREILRYFRDIEKEFDTPHFFSYAICWYWQDKSKKAKKTDIAELLDELIHLRNQDNHGLMKTEYELLQERTELLKKVQHLLFHSKWLQGYSLFRVADVKKRRGGGESGKLYKYKGKENLLPEDAIWSCPLFSGVMYISTPDGMQILEIDPFIFSEQLGREEELFVWFSTPKEKRIDLRCDRTGTEKQQLIFLGEDQYQWNVWLSKRDNLEPIQKNIYSEYFCSHSFQDIGYLIDDRYRIQKKLGEGGMASVYEVHDEVMDTVLALKILHLEQVDTKTKERTKKEFRFMKSLQHPNILSVKEMLSLSDGRIAITLPLMEGTLQDFIENTVVDNKMIYEWGEKLLSALNYLHNREKPIYHRDIKPSNILYDSKGNIYLSDFGIARREGDIRLTRTMEQIGSLPYMAPELLRGQQASAASDRYSLGITLHEICTGAIPKEVGKGIEGELGILIQQLSHQDSDKRLQVIFSNDSLTCQDNQNIPLDVPSSENIAIYKQHMEDVAEDGILEDFEVHFLNEKRKELQISEQLHEELLGKYTLIRGVPFQLDLNSDSFQQIEQNFVGYMRVKVTEALHEMIVYTHCNILNHPIHQSNIRRLRPQSGYKDISVCMIPYQSGSYVFEILIKVITKEQQVGWYINQTPIDVLISTSQGGVKHVQLKIEDTLSNTSKDVSQSVWSNLAFVAEHPDDAEIWLKNKQSTQDEPVQKEENASLKSTFSIMPPMDLLSGTPLQKCKITLIEETEKQIECIVKSKVSFGHHTTLSDMQILVEPIHSFTNDDPNLAKSLQISRKHFEISFEENSIYFSDLGSSNGTFFNKQRLKRQERITIENRIPLTIANVLDIEIERINDSNGMPSAAIIHRVNSNPNKCHVILHQQLGLWFEQNFELGQSVSEDKMAPLSLFCNERNELCLQNNQFFRCTILETNGNTIQLEKQQSIILKGSTLLIEVNEEHQNMQIITIENL